MAIIGCSETSATTIQRRVTSQKIENFIYTLLRRGGSLKSRSEFYYETLQHVSGLPEKFGESPYTACILTPLTRVIQKLTRFHLVPKPPRILCNPKFHYNVSKNQPRVLTRTQKFQNNQIQTDRQTERCDLV